MLKLTLMFSIQFEKFNEIMAWQTVVDRLAAMDFPSLYKELPRFCLDGPLPGYLGHLLSPLTKHSNHFQAPHIKYLGYVTF